MVECLKKDFKPFGFCKATPLFSGTLEMFSESISYGTDITPSSSKE